MSPCFRRSPRRAQRAMTLLEVIVSVAIVAMMALLIYGAFDSLARGRRGEALRADRARQGRQAIARMVREFSSAFLTGHQPLVVSQQTRITAFVGEDSTQFDRVDFASFAHRRLDRDAKESDQAEVGYAVVDDPAVDGKKDLIRREQTPIDLEPRRGGTTAVLAEDVESFELRYLDPLTGLWTDRWDTTQISGQPNRLPLEVSIKLTLKNAKDADPLKFETKLVLPMREPLTFGNAR